MRRNAAVFLLVFLTRLPFLGPGFGADADAWRIAGAARTIAADGRYVASRFPGAPVVEIADSLLLPLGPWTLPLASALWGAIGAAVFYVALCRLGARGCFWAALALGFTPVFWIHTTDAMDYAWALGFGLVGLAFAVYGRPTLAGFAVGLAIGCRITSAAFLVPLALLLPRAALGRFVLAAVISAGLALAPSFLTYGTRFLSGYEFGHIPWIYVLKAATRDVWGVIGTVAIGVATLFGLARIRQVPRRELWAVVSAIVLFGAIFLRLPHDGAYLLPIVPFVLLFFTRTLPKPALAGIALALAMSSLFVDVYESAYDSDPSIAGRHIGFDFQRGPLMDDRAQRAADLETRDLILEMAKGLPPNSVVMIYEQLPLVEWAEPASQEPRFVHLLRPEEAALAKRVGWPIYATPAAIDKELEVYGLSDRDIGIRMFIPRSSINVVPRSRF